MKKLLKNKNIRWLLILVVMILAYIGFNKIIERKSSGEAPVITFSEEDITRSVYDDPSRLIDDLTATDAEDGDLSKEVIVDSLGSFNNSQQRSITYAVFDSDGNVTKATRMIHYVDYSAPEFYFTGSLSGSSVSASTFSKLIRAKSCVDGDISNKINTKTYYDLTNHKVTLEVSVADSTGTTESETFVYTYDTNDYTITINLNKYIMYINQGENIDLYGNISSVTSYNADDEILAGEVYIDASNVDVNTPGVYEITYAINHLGAEGFSKCIVVVK